VYEVGDSIPGGARLDAVLRQEVLLERNGQLRSLTLPRQTLAGAPPAQAGLPVSPMTSPVFVARMRALVARRPGIVADLLRPEPVFSGGKQLGYRVYPGNDPQAFEQLGLKPGDLVMAINGTPLDDPAQDQQILGTLGSSSQATVTVLRDGRQRTLTLNLAQVEQAAQSLNGARGAPAAVPPSPPLWPSRHPDPFNGGAIE
jgi:general secretion pathway protein C